MSAIHWLALIVVVVLGAYLLFALLYPEKF